MNAVSDTHRTRCGSNRPAARRSKSARTFVPDANAPCPLDRVTRQFKAPSPNPLWVADFTCVSAGLLETRCGSVFRVCVVFNLIAFLALVHPPFSDLAPWSAV